MKRTFQFVLFFLPFFCWQSTVISQPQIILDSLKQELASASDDSIRAFLLRDLARASFGVNTNGLRYAKQSLKLFQKMDNKEMIAELYSNVGSHFNDPDSAIYYINKSMEKHEEYGLPKVKRYGANLYNLGLIHQEKGDHDTAYEYYQKSLVIREAEKDTAKIGKTYQTIGTLYLRKGELDLATEYFLKSIPLLEQVKNKRVLGGVNYNMSICKRLQRKFEEAKPYLEKARDLAEETGAFSMMVRVSHELAELEDDPEKKIEIESKALDIARTIGDKSGEAMALTNLGRFYYGIGEKQKAVDYFSKGIKLTEEFGFSFEMGQQYTVYAEMLNDLKKPREAIIYANKAIQVIDKSESKSILSDAYHELASAYLQMGDFKKAYELKVIQHEIQDSVLNEKTTLQIADMETKYETEQKEKEIAILEKDKAVQTAEIERRKTQTLYAVGGVLLLLAIAGLLYYRFRYVDRLQKQLAKLNAAKDRLFSIISHDLRDSVSSFQNVGQIISYYIEKGHYDRLQTVGQQVGKSANNLNNLLDNLLQWSVSQMEGVKIDPGKVSVEKAVDEIVELFKENASVKGIQLSAGIEPGLTTYADINSLKLVLRNLVSNALKFSEEGDAVTIAGKSNKQFVHIEVKDTGQGIPPEKMENIFHIDRKSSSKGTAGEQGVGLGLALCKEFVERNGGQIQLKSEVGKGTVCEFRLPKAA